MRTTLTVLVAIGLVTCARDAGAAAHSARLVYVRAKDAVVCADEEGVRAAVAKRLGYDPFVGFADMTLIVDVRRAAVGFSADLRVVHADGVSAGVRVLESKSDDCGALVDALALTMSIVVDPVSALRAGGAPPEANKDAPPPNVPTPAAPAAPMPARTPTQGPVDAVIREPEAAPPPAAQEAPARIRPVIAVAPFGSVGEDSGLTGGGIVHASLERGAFAIGLEARADLASQRAQSGAGELRAHSASGWLVPCAVWPDVEACALVGLGAVFAESSGFASPRSDVGLYFGAGARVAIPLEIGTIAIVRPFADAIVQPFRTRYELNGATVYRASPFGADVGLLVGARFR